MVVQHQERRRAICLQHGAKVSISVDGRHGDWWTLDFDAPGLPGQPAAGPAAELVPGTYTDTHRYPLNGTGPSPNLGGDGRGCNKSTGSFTITRAVFGPQGYVQAFDATFVQHCEGATAAARGEVHISNPPAPPEPSPSPTTASPHALPTFEPTATDAGRDAALAGGRAAGAPPTTTVWTDANRARFIGIGVGVIAVVILVVNVLMGVHSWPMRRAILSLEPRPTRSATTGGAVMGPWSTDDSVEHRWPQYDPSPPVARRSLPGKVIAVTVVFAVRGMLGLLLTAAMIGVLHLRAVQELPLPSWYANVLWLQVGICAGEVVSGLLLMRGKQWPRMLGLSVLWFDIAAGTLIMLATTFSCGGLVGIAVDVVLIWMLFWTDVEEWCY